jgi:hypothetical protein
MSTRWCISCCTPRTAALPALTALYVLPAGPQKELDIWPVFGILADMLIRSGAAASVHLLMIGPDVPDGMHNKEKLLGALTACLRLASMQSQEYSIHFMQDIRYIGTTA